MTDTQRELARVTRRIRRVCATYADLCRERDALIRASLAAGASLRRVGEVCDLSHGTVALIRDNISETSKGAR